MRHYREKWERGDRSFRWELGRDWQGLLDDQKTVLFVGLNPSTADGHFDDPTIIREVVYATGWGFNRLLAGNLYGFRATAPAALYSWVRGASPDERAEEEIDNLKTLRSLARQAQLHIAAWGAQAEERYGERCDAVRGILQAVDVHVIELTKYRSPRHPLYCKKDLKPKLWVPGGKR